MFSILKDFRFSFCQIYVFVVIYGISRADEESSFSRYQKSEENVVVEEQSAEGTCSYILTVPKSQCSCNCEEEFRRLIDGYENRLKEMENRVMGLLAQIQQDSVSVAQPSSSFQLLHSLDSRVDLSTVMTDSSTPGATEFNKLSSLQTSTQEPATELITMGTDLQTEASQEAEEVEKELQEESQEAESQVEEKMEGKVEEVSEVPVAESQKAESQVAETVEETAEDSDVSEKWREAETQVAERVEESEESQEAESQVAEKVVEEESQEAESQAAETVEETAERSEESQVEEKVEEKAKESMESEESHEMESLVAEKVVEESAESKEKSQVAEQVEEKAEESDESEEESHEESHEAEATVKAEEDAEPTTTTYPVTSETPIIVTEENEQDDPPFVHFKMTAKVEEFPVRVNDQGSLDVNTMYGYVVLPGSDEEKTKLGDSRSGSPPPIEASKQFDEVLDEIVSSPPAPNPHPSILGLELNLAAHKANNYELEAVIPDEFQGFNDGLEAFHSPEQLLKSTQPKELQETEKHSQPEEKRPPGFVEGMETAAGYAGDVNRPQWKKLEHYLAGPEVKTNTSTKRERPSGMERVPSCTRDGCACLISKGKTSSGIYKVPNVPGSGKRGVLVDVFCDVETKHGGWTVIQRRQNGSANFYRNWNHYAHGFGYLDDSFWIGNRMLHALTRRFNYELRIEFTDWNSKTGFAEYDSFYVGSEDDNFRLNVGRFTAGNRGNAFSYHNGTMFSTYDRDNDKSEGECAVLRQAGFWFKNCNKMNPNGRWIPFPDGTGLNGAVVTWGTWSRHLFTYSLKDFKMMIRPTSRSDYA